MTADEEAEAFGELDAAQPNGGRDLNQQASSERDLREADPSAFGASPTLWRGSEELGPDGRAREDYVL